MTTFETVSNAQHLAAAARLRDLVPELTAAALTAKQAHWNTVGPSFLPLHALTDEIALDIRTWTDRVAERAVALGVPVDGRPRTVAAVASDFPSGSVRDDEMVAELDAELGRVTRAANGALRDLEMGDPVGHDIVVEVLEGLEKYRWMLRAHTMRGVTEGR